MFRAALIAICCIAVFPAALAHAAGKTHERAHRGNEVRSRAPRSGRQATPWSGPTRIFCRIASPRAQARVESGDLTPGKTFRFVARKKGEMPYICRLHPVMKGVLVVK